MRILLLGYPDYLSNLLANLNNTPFITENDIDIIFANSSNSNKLSNLKSLKKIKKNSLGKLVSKILMNFFSNSYSKIKNKLFQEVDLSFINYLTNVKIIKYEGLDNILGLEDYDFMIVATFGQKIPKEIFNKPKRRTLNIHPSYLPELRGGYPTYVEAYKSTIKSATTIHFMEEKWDNGDIVIQKKYKVDYKLNNNDRFLLSSSCAASLLNELHEIDYKFTPKKQIGEITYCHKIIRPKTNLLRITKNENIEGFIRANYAKHIFPFTYVFYKFNLLSIIEVSPISDISIISKKHINSNVIKVFKLNRVFILNFYGKFYKLNRYIYKRKLYAD